MMDNFIDELNQIREEAEKNYQPATEELDLSVLGGKTSATRLLSTVNAHNLLRRTRAALLGNKGIIDVFDHSTKYERAVALIWQGSIASPRSPTRNDPSDCYFIMVGAKNGKVYVNGKQIKPHTPEALKVALVSAAKKPGVKRAKKIKK